MSSPERLASGMEDERSPLLLQRDDDPSDYRSAKPSVSISSEPTPLPKLQIGVCLLIQFAEPITALCILPFINQLVSELDVTHGDETKVGYYVGIIVRIYTLLSPTFRGIKAFIFGRTRCSSLSRPSLFFSGAVFLIISDVSLYC